MIRQDTVAVTEPGWATEPRQTPDLPELAAYIDRVTRALPDPQGADLSAALRRVWLRNRLPESVPAAAVCDIADHCDLATISALVSLGITALPRVDPQPATAWEEPAATQESPVAGWGLL